MIWLGVGLWMGFLMGVIVAGIFYARGEERRIEQYAAERAEWVAERRDLNNRIQVPEAAPFMDTGATPIKQFVSYDDDEGFDASQEESPAWP